MPKPVDYAKQNEYLEALKRNASKKELGKISSSIGGRGCMEAYISDRYKQYDMKDCLKMYLDGYEDYRTKFSTV